MMAGTKIDLEVEGLNTTLGQLKDLASAAEMTVLEVIMDVVTTTHEIAVQGIQGGPKTGITYWRVPGEDGIMRVYAGNPDGGVAKLVAAFRTGGKANLSLTHTASAPGQYPASDTGQLASSVAMNLPTSARLTGEVGTNVMHGKWLEFGTTKIAPRPWLLPSFRAALVGVEQEMKSRLEARLK